ARVLLLLEEEGGREERGGRARVALTQRADRLLVVDALEVEARVALPRLGPLAFGDRVAAGALDLHDRADQPGDEENRGRGDRGRDPPVALRGLDRAPDEALGVG